MKRYYFCKRWSVLIFAAVWLAGVGVGLAVGFTKSMIPVDNSIRLDVAVAPDGRNLFLWTAGGTENLDDVELWLSELHVDGKFTSESLGIVGHGALGSGGFFDVRLRLATKGGRTWALVRTGVRGEPEMDLKVVQVYPRPSTYEFELVERGFMGGTLDLAVGDDGQPWVMFQEPLGRGARVKRRLEGGVMEDVIRIPEADGWSFYGRGGSLAVDDGRVAITVTASKLVGGDVYEYGLRCYQTSVPGVGLLQVLSDFSLVAYNAASEGLSGWRQRSVFLAGSISPVVIFRNEIANIGQVAVRDPSFGWQVTDLPSAGGSAPRGFYVDIESDEDGDGHLVWIDAPRKIGYSRYAVGTGFYGVERLDDQWGCGASVGVGPTGIACVGGIADGVGIEGAIPTDFTDVDGNGFTLLEEEAFGMLPGVVSFDRRPRPVVFEEGGRRYPAISFWRLPGGVGNQPYLAGNILYTVETSIDGIHWFSTTFFNRLAESFTIAGRGQFVTYRAPFDFGVTGSRTKRMFRVRVERF